MKHPIRHDMHDGYPPGKYRLARMPLAGDYDTGANASDVVKLAVGDKHYTNKTLFYLGCDGEHHRYIYSYDARTLGIVEYEVEPQPKPSLPELAGKALDPYYQEASNIFPLIQYFADQMKHLREHVKGDEFAHHPILRVMLDKIVQLAGGVADFGSVVQDYDACIKLTVGDPNQAIYKLSAEENHNVEKDIS